MFGGTAKTYAEWEQSGSPYKDGNAYYIKVVHPLTKSLKTVRWYNDKKHNDWMPKRDNPYGPFYKVFGFKSADDTIVCIRKKDITNEEEEHFFGCQRGWRFGMFFDGVWYAPQGTPLPPTKRDKYFTPTWAEFRRAGQENSRKLGLVSDAASVWFQEENE